MSDKFVVKQANMPHLQEIALKHIKAKQINVCVRVSARGLFFIFTRKMKMSTLLVSAVFHVKHSASAKYVNHACKVLAVSEHP